MSDPSAQFPQFGPLFYGELNNVFTGELLGFSRPDWMRLPGGAPIHTATPGQQDSLTFWLGGPGSDFHIITQAQAFVQDLFLHYATGSLVHVGQSPGEVALGLQIAPQHLTTEELLFAVHTMPAGLGVALVDTFTESAIVSYAQHEAPQIMLVGQPTI